MLLAEFFDFLAPDDIRVKGHRVGIETILFDYLDGLTPEEIALRYPTLSLKEIYTTIAFYWRNQAEIDAYLHSIEAHEAKMRREQEQNPPDVVKRLRAMKSARRTQTLDPKLRVVAT